MVGAEGPNEPDQLDRDPSPSASQTEAEAGGRPAQSVSRRQIVSGGLVLLWSTPLISTFALAQTAAKPDKKGTTPKGGSSAPASSPSSGS